MNTTFARWLGLLAAAAVVLGGLGVHGAAGQSSDQSEAAPITAVVSIPPLKGLIEPMLPRGSTVEVLIPPGVSEHGYEIPPRKLANLNKADLVVLVGLGLEPAVEKFLRDRPRAKAGGQAGGAGGAGGRLVITFAEAADVESMPADQVPQSGCGASCTHHHGEDGGDGHEHHHAADPHLWLDPVLCRKLVERVADTLIEREAVRTGQAITSDHSIVRGRDEVLAGLDRLDREFRALADSAANKTIVVGHDAYGWLAKRYGFETIAIAGLHANEPTPRAINNAIEAVKAKGVKVVFVEPQLNQSAGRRIARAAGAQVRVLDPLGDGDYFKLMDRNLAAMREAMGVNAEGAGGVGERRAESGSRGR